MKTTPIIPLMALSCAVVLALGCGQKEQPPVTPTTPTSKLTQPEPPRAIVPPAPAIPLAPAIATAPAMTPADVTTDTSRAPSLIAHIRSLITEKKYPEALRALKDLSAMELTPDQQASSADLKTQVEKAIQAQATTDATKSVGEMFGK